MELCSRGLYRGEVRGQREKARAEEVGKTEGRRRG